MAKRPTKGTPSLEKTLEVASRAPAGVQRATAAATREWFKSLTEAVSGTGKVTANKLMTEDTSRLKDKVTRYNTGQMFAFFYDPKLKKKLPYYDVFPLVIPLRVYGGRMLGVNLHYLPPLLRAKLLDALRDTLNNTKYDDSTKMRVNYRILKSASKYNAFKPCLKLYLMSHVKSRFYAVRSADWERVVLLPLERFQKKTKTQVWAQSLSKI